MPRFPAAASFVPSLLEAIASHSSSKPLPTGPTGLHDCPESQDVQIPLPRLAAGPLSTAASFVPSLLEVIPLQYRSGNLCLPLHSVHDCPESVDVQMPPRLTTAASFVPSLLDVIAVHSSMPPNDLNVHDCPESQDVQMPPLFVNVPPGFATAASFVPSLLDVIAFHNILPGFTPRGHAGSGGRGEPRAATQAPHFPLFFPGFREHWHRLVDTRPHFLRFCLPCTASHASFATAQVAAQVTTAQVGLAPHLQSGLLLHGLLFLLLHTGGFRPLFGALRCVPSAAA